MRYQHTPEPAKYATRLRYAQALDQITVQYPISYYELDTFTTESTTTSKYAPNDASKQQWISKCEDDYAFNVGSTLKDSASSRYKSYFAISSNSRGNP